MFFTIVKTQRWFDLMSIFRTFFTYTRHDSKVVLNQLALMCTIAWQINKMKTFSAKYVKYIMIFKAGLSVRSSVLPSAPAHTTWLPSSHVFLQKFQYHVHPSAHGSHFMMSGVPLQGCQALAHSIIHFFLKL